MKKFFVSAIGVFVLIPSVIGFAKPVNANPALAYCQTITDPIQRYYCEGRLMSSQAQWDKWSTYTPRQQQFTYTISQLYSNYSQRYGQPIPVNQQTLAQIIQYLGANQSERQFVYERMMANYNGIIGITQADQTISR